MRSGMRRPYIWVIDKNPCHIQWYKQRLPITPVFKLKSFFNIKCGSDSLNTACILVSREKVYWCTVSFTAELMTRWSRNARFIYYIQWNLEQLGAPRGTSCQYCNGALHTQIPCGKTVSLRQSIHCWKMFRLADQRISQHLNCIVLSI